ncbi:helix-turn-helix transcriptional regulator [Sporichthya brevicatena]|uniref:helix-turn-helix transcriptional regulator n=1 Tax=Sporichthya brevicatena TaxID=171442 RepID=UPI003CD0A3E7
MKTVRDPNSVTEAPARDLGPVEDVTAGTREKVARAILENGRSTAADLAAQLDLTPAAVRRHLDALLADGVIEEAEPRGQAHRGRGRPAKVFVVTDAGRHHFVQAYDDLAASALRFLAETAGVHAVEQFAARRVAELEERYRRVVEQADPADRPAVLAEALSADGYAASIKPAPGGALGEQVCQHHCPVAHVAEQFPQLCEAETQAFARLLGTHVQRLATIAHGDGVCTTYVPTVATTGRTTS